jgi:hypothetical protein
VANGNWKTLPRFVIEATRARNLSKASKAWNWHSLYLDLALDKIRKEEGSKIERKKNGSRSREFKMGTKSITLRIHNNVLLLFNRSLSSFFQQICLSLCLLWSVPLSLFPPILPLPLLSRFRYQSSFLSFSPFFFTFN